MNLVLPDVSFMPLLPILIVLAGAIISTLGGFWMNRRTLTTINIVMLLLSALSMVWLWGAAVPHTAFGGAVRADAAALLLGGVVVLGSVLTLLVSLDTAYRARVSFAEFDAMLMYAITGCLLIAFSGDFVVMLIGLEIMSLASYVLATLQDSRRAEESGLKYFLLGSVGSAILIYGIAFLYGATGTLNYAGVAERVGVLEPQNVAILVTGALLVLSGFAFKVALAPFHQWTPDVYSGAPTSVSLFLSTVVKVAAFAGMLRVFGGALGAAPGWHSVLQVLIAVTLVIGNAAALAIVAALQRSEEGFSISDMRGLYYRQPTYAIALAVCLAFQAAFQSGYVWLTLLASVASLVYYLRPAMLMFMPDRTPAREYAHGQRPATSFAVVLSVVGILLLGLLPNLWYGWVSNPEAWRLIAGL